MGRAQSSTTASEAATLLGDYVDGERGRKLRSQLASMHPRRSPEEVEDAVQTACRCFLGEAEGIEAPGQVYAWIRTTAHRALNREDKRGERVQAVDPVEGSLARAPSEEAGPAEEAIADEEASELTGLVREVAGALPERKRRVLALYGAGYKRPQIASRLGLTRRGVKRDLLEIMDEARAVLARRAGGGCEHGERLVVRLACGLASPEEAERAHRHLAGCGRCGQLSERLAAWREKVPAVLPFPAADQAAPGLLERAAHKAADGLAAVRGHLADGGASLKQQAAAGYYRAVDPTPLAAARPGAVAAVVAGCITLGSGATYCVQRGVVDPLGTARSLVAGEAREPEPEPEPVRAPAEPPEPEPEPEPPPEAPAAEEVPVSEEAASAPEAEEPAPEPEPEPEPEPVPPPPPEQTFEPSSPGYSEASASSTESAGAEAAEEGSPASPAPVPAGSSPEFGGP